MQNAGSSPTTRVVWVLGVALILAHLATSQAWHAVAGATFGPVLPAGAEGKPAPAGSYFQAGTLLTQTAGLVLLVMLLAGIASTSEGGELFAVLILLALWLWFALRNEPAIIAFFGLFSPPATEEIRPAGITDTPSAAASVARPSS
jgi:hypothetical protein